MKYIRTKDKILELDDNGIPTTNRNITMYHAKGFLYGFLEREILKFSDTIEELCDEFVLCEDNHYCIVGDIEAKEMATTNYGIIYGAIWTDKGLIYVAEMNDKGELELL